MGVSSGGRFPQEVSIPVSDTAACIYLLHDAAGKAEVCASVRIEYTDSSGYTQYLQRGRQLGSWWFPSLQHDMAGVAWSGPNARSSRVGAYWAAIDNPHPEKKIRRIVVRAADDGDVYALMAVSLSDQKHYVRPKGKSFGGPDNWAAATAMAALIEGLAGITDSGVAYSRPVIAPRWVAAGVELDWRHIALSGFRGICKLSLSACCGAPSYPAGGDGQCGVVSLPCTFAGRGW